MAGHFLDTSALAKHYHSELGSQTVDALLAESSNSCIVSRLGIVEFHSAVARRVRMGQIASDAGDLLRSRLLSDVKDRLFFVVAMRSTFFDDAIRLLAAHGNQGALKTLDALQLAAAIDLKRLDQVEVFVAADQRLLEIAAREGLKVLNPEQ